MATPDYKQFFRRATGLSPWPFQVRVANGQQLPDVLEAPPGSGKTAAIVLAWLYRRTQPQPGEGDRAALRLAYALPQRSLVEQVARETAGWLERLELTDDIDLVVLMGGTTKKAGRRNADLWRQSIDRPTIVIGTVDQIASRALFRGYGISRKMYPVDAAVLLNDTHIVIDEIQLAPESTATLRQLQGFSARATRLGQFGLTCMSATINSEYLDTVDNPATDITVARLDERDLAGGLATRINATRTISRLAAAPGNPKSLATAIASAHQPGTRTLAIVNTVKLAQEVHTALTKLNLNTDLLLLHSRFRGVERSAAVELLSEPLSEQGQIVISTQVIEAGVDIDSATLVTELASWSSVVQRSGRCNRRGVTDNARLLWLPPLKPAPYEEADVKATQEAMLELESQAVSNRNLLNLDVAELTQARQVLRWPDLLGLFDTTPDLTGNDLDIAPYVRDSEDLDVSVCWLDLATWPPASDLRLPDPEWFCRVPVPEARRFIESGRRLWRFDQQLARWTSASAQTPRPGEVFVADARDGGYSLTLGIEIKSRTIVMPTGPESSDATDGFGLGSPQEDGFGDDYGATGRGWLALDSHLEETAAECARIVEQLPFLDVDTKADLVLAAALHDVGKAHPTWQNAVCNLASEQDRAGIEAGRPWAKSGSQSRLTYADDVDNFRHELSSLLLLDGPLSGLLAGAHDRNLVRYLVLAHHGKLRVQVREPEVRGRTDNRLLGLLPGEEVAIPAVASHPPTVLHTVLDQFRVGISNDADTDSWTDTALELLERHGPFRLAFYESIVRIADWRASARPSGMHP
jgi:CRISPR-associated endonuclease/helicase Cas3